MVSLNISQPYESSAVRAVTGPAIRPGGLTLTGRAADHCRLGPGDRVLDVGCGTGATADFLTARYGARVVGMDLSDILLAEARRQHPKAVLVRGDADRLPLKTAGFNAVFCECVCSLLSDPARALDEWQRVLVPGGTLVLADLYCRMPRTPMAGPAAAAGCLGGATDRPTMFRRIRSAGFAVEVWEDHSQALKRLAAEMVWAGVSLTGLWGESCSRGACSHDNRPGYGLIVARKC